MRQEIGKLSFFWKKVAKIFGGLRNLPYLCTRFREKTSVWVAEAYKELLDQWGKSKLAWSSESREKSRPKGIKEFFERLTSTEKGSTRSKFDCTLSQKQSVPCLRHGNRKRIFLQWRVWSWLRMNASYRLNTCKSRGSMEVACNLWWRPAHGWVTRIQPSPR